MINKEFTLEQLQSIIKDVDASSNKDLSEAMDFLTNDFNETKSMIIDLTNHLDNIEGLYNKILAEYENRVNGQFIK
jgi:predicted DNA-binding ArsR family transcriptional regulator